MNSTETPKKERSPAQIAAFEKARNKLMENREKKRVISEVNMTTPANTPVSGEKVVPNIEVTLREDKRKTLQKSKKTKL